MVFLLILGLGSAARADLKHRFGVGAHYWVTADDIEFDNVDEDGFAYLLSYQIRPLRLIKFELALELKADIPPRRLTVRIAPSPIPI